MVFHQSIGMEKKNVKNMQSNKYEFYKNNDTDQIWWVDNPEKIGVHLFSFDKQKIYNLFEDYPQNLTKEQKEIFDKENTYWKDFFSNR